MCKLEEDGGRGFAGRVTQIVAAGFPNASNSGFKGALERLADNGNWRVVMPFNERKVDVQQAFPLRKHVAAVDGCTFSPLFS